MRTHVRHIQQSQSAHRALRHETVASIRAAHQQALAQLQPHIDTFARAYASELQRIREARDDDTAHVPLTWLHGNDRLGTLKASVRSSIRGFTIHALGVTLAAKRQAVQQAQEDATHAIHKALERVPPEKRPPVQHIQPVPPEAIHREVQETNNGSPVSTLYDGMDDEADDEVQQAVTSVALGGWNDTMLRIAILAALRISLNRALTIARNEPLAAYRDVQLKVYVANGNFLRGWTWQAQLGSCCLACALMHGSVHDISEEMDSHVNCVCTAVPLAEGDDSDNGDIETGYQWLQRQDDSVLQDKLGNAAYLAYKAGDVDLDQFLRVSHDPQWGDSIYTASLRELGLDASDYVE